MIRVSWYKRLMPDKSYTLGIRWIDPKTGQEVRRMVGIRTDPKPGKKALEKAIDRAKAEVERQSEQLNREATADVPVQNLELRQAATMFVAWCDTRGANGLTRSAEGTTANKARHIDSLIHFCHSYHWHLPARFALSYLNRNMLALWRDDLEKRGYGAATVNTMLASASSWLAWAVDYGHVKFNPCSGLLRLRTIAKRADGPLADPENMRQELGRILERLAPGRFRAAAIFLACTGLRQGELRGLKVRDVDVEEAVLQVPAGRESTKRHARTIPLCRQATEAARELLDLAGDEPSDWLLPSVRDPSRPMTSQLSKAFKRAGATPHAFRRFFQTALETVGTPKNVVCDLLAHSPGRVRAAYTPASNIEAARPWIEAFSRWLGDT